MSISEAEHQRRVDTAFKRNPDAPEDSIASEIVDLEIEYEETQAEAARSGIRCLPVQHVANYLGSPASKVETTLQRLADGGYVVQIGLERWVQVVNITRAGLGGAAPTPVTEVSQDAGSLERRQGMGRPESFHEQTRRILAALPKWKEQAFEYNGGDEYAPILLPDAGEADFPEADDRGDDIISTFC